jgi:hypothetical protein
MSRYRIAIVAAALALCSHALVADVRVDEKTHVEFAGMMGKMMNFFGGKSAREGVVSTVAVKGERKATMNDEKGTIVDLGEEKMYELDLKKKTYKVTTFDELRRRLEEAQKKAAENMQKAKEKAAEKPSKPEEMNVEFDVDVKNTGQRKMINGFDSRESIMTITVRQKGKTLAQAGGMVLTLDQWLTPKIAAMKEVADFDMRFAKKVYAGLVAGVPAEQMAAATAMYPMMKQALGRMTTEGAKIDGTPILSTMTMDAVRSDEQVAQEAKETKTAPADSGGKIPTSVGGLLGGLAKRAAAKKAAEDETEKGDKSRATFMTTTTEVLKFATDVPASDVAIPSGFKETK